MRSMNFLVRTDKLLSCLPRALSLLPLLLALTYSSSSSSFKKSSSVALLVIFLVIRFPIHPTSKLTIKIIISRSSYKILYFAQTVKLHSIGLALIYEQPTKIIQAYNFNCFSTIIIGIGLYNQI